MMNFRMLKWSDKYIWVAFFLLILIGLFMIFSSTFSGEDKAGRDGWLYVKKQLAAFVFGLACMAVAMYFDYTYFKSLSPVLYFFMLGLLVVGQVMGTASMGAQRWINLGPLTFQPSEIAKLIMIIVLASYFDLKKEASNIIPALVLAGIPFLLVFKQPDLGTSLVIVGICLGMMIWSKTSPILLTMILTPILSLIFRQNFYFWAFYLIALWGILYFLRVKLWDMLLILGINIGIGLAFPLLWGMLKEYQRMRIMAFINPWSDPHGAGYHTLQSKIAIGSGGLLGKGFMQGSQTQLQYIPIQHSDFIFSAIGEEFGLVGTLATLSLLVTILWRTILIASEARDFLGGCLASGIAMLIGFHVFVNIGMTMGLLPVVGIPLPLVSYGGTSLFVTMIAIGILQNIAMRRQRLIF